MSPSELNHAVPKEPGRRGRPWRAMDTRRLSAAERGYDARWQRASMGYRQRNPLCVECWLAGYVMPSTCVDHIVPIHSCPELRMDPENWAALCSACHGRKTRMEPQASWEPRRDRIVVCGWPGCGKTTFAKASGLPYWDADERLELSSVESIVAAREQWIEEQRGLFIVIVASTMTACLIAARVRGVVKHMTEQFVERAPRTFTKQ